jgi:3',5'-cyclic-AMP phosphodiesterase
VIAGDVTDEGYPDQYLLAKDRLGALACPRVVAVPGNHDARHVGYRQFERVFGARDSLLRMSAAGVDVALVAVDSSKPDITEGEIDHEHYAWILQGFAGPANRASSSATTT